MSADAGLALAQKLSQVFDVELAILKEPEEAKASRLRSRPQARNGVAKAIHDRPRHERLIKICLYVFKAELPTVPRATLIEEEKVKGANQNHVQLLGNRHCPEGPAAPF